MQEPSLVGVRPRFEAKIAFSIGPSIGFSHGMIERTRGSVAFTLARWRIGVGVP